MADEPQGSVQREEDQAMKDTADENSKAIRSEYEGNSDDFVVPSQNLQPSAAPAKSKTGTDAKAEVPEINIKPQR